MYLRIGPSENPGMPKIERIAFARGHARKAVQLAESLGRAHAAMGGVSLNDYDFARAEEALKRALELDPAVVVAHQLLMNTLIFQRRFDEVLAQAEWGYRSDSAPRRRSRISRMPTS